MSRAVSACSIAPPESVHDGERDRAAPSGQKALGYRPEIDGLRAIAVLAVIFYHADVAWLRGGYLGVDIFFVLSGYLITTIILSERQRGSFSYLNFYERRARRIAPALFFVMGVCIPFAMMFMMPQQLTRFFQSVITVVTFSSNIFFWRTIDYFDPASEGKPLLHTWSLGVEEQFYMLFPPIVMLLWGLGARRMGAIFLVTAFLSLCLSDFASNHRRYAAASFYLAPTRAWELLAGSLLALGTVFKSERPAVSLPIREALSLLGIGLIAFSLVALDEHTPIPGFCALLPVSGTALVLCCGTRDSFVGKILATRPMVIVGLISYSAYLWHVPLLAFVYILSFSEPSPLVLLPVALCSLPLAYASWKYIEAPMRSRAVVSSRTIFLFTVLGTLFFLFVGMAGWLSAGFEWRVPAEKRALYQALKTAVSSATEKISTECQYAAESFSASLSFSAALSTRFETCVQSHGRALIVLGDSHGQDLYNAIAPATSQSHIADFSMPSCRPWETKPGCHFDEAAAFIERHRGDIEAVLYTSKGSYFLRGGKGPALEQPAIQATQHYLARIAQSARVIWLGPQAEPNVNLRELNLLLGEDRLVSALTENAFIRELDEKLQTANRGQAFEYISKLKAVDYRFERDFFVQGQFTYSDTDHWSTFGERYFGERLIYNTSLNVLLRAASQ